MIDPVSQLDAALGGILAQGWDEPPAPAVDEPAQEPQPPAESGAGALETVEGYPPLPQRDDGPPGDDPGEERGMLDIGLLTDLATGKKGAVEAAQAAGVTTQQLQSSLAIALREVPPEEIAKALGLQAAEQQLKSGALYGAVLADLVADMAVGRLKPEAKIELAKLLARIGRVEPKEAKEAGGSSFVLNISMGSGTPPVTIEAG